MLLDGELLSEAVLELKPKYRFNQYNAHKIELIERCLDVLDRDRGKFWPILIPVEKLRLLQ